MAEVKITETMLATENQQEATELMQFLGELDPNEKKYFMVFMEAFRLSKSLNTQLTTQTS